MTSSKRPSLGFIGLGAMGGPMVRHLLGAGHRVTVHDLNRERMDLVTVLGAESADDAVAVARESDVVFTSLPSSEAWARVAEESLLPHARSGQVIVDVGTVAPPETRRLAALFAARGATLVDAPVSGGPEGAEAARLRMFVGGDPEAIACVRPLLDVIAGAETVSVCGPAGAGQVVKGVNQLAMGLGAAAFLEALSLAVNAGVDPDAAARAVGGGLEPWREQFSRIARPVVEGRGETVGVKFRELPYFLREATEAGFRLPLTETLYQFCDAGERVVIDDNRPAPSFWHELTRETGTRDEG